ncbi:AGAP011344-PA-like protein [Anopheles sinensis]|uniref:AGAP011344-PA-like protein n=1 Tax=Anopheles sinensis TaxID=74873 RepID=A0A084VHX6_ANOSI|nr:AGAP011344-PA-like protein [Anopheles sinensis]
MVRFLYSDMFQQPSRDGVDSINTVSAPSAPPLLEVEVPQQPSSSRTGSSRNSPRYTPAVASSSRRGEPPTYEEAVDIETPPPSYDSLFGRVREAHKSSKGVFDFVTNVVILVLGTLGCTIILGITIVIPVCMIVLGTLYLYDCPQGEYIPVYLLVGGAFGVLKQLLHLSTRVRSREEQELERLRQTPTQTLINCFMLGWFIIGSFWVYQIYEPNYDPALGKYCNKSLYLFTFWLITSVYMTLGVVIVVLCSVSIMSVLLLPQS